MDYYKILSIISLPLGVTILLILACRSLVLWYFKIPDMIDRQDELIRAIEKQNALMEKSLGIASPETSIPKEVEIKIQQPTFTELRYGKS